MANIENLKPFTKDNASVYGRKGGIASGITRRRKAYLKKKTYSIYKLAGLYRFINRSGI